MLCMKGLNCICFNCRKYGHNREEWNSQSEGDKNDENRAVAKSAEKKVMEQFGPWMIATNN